MNLKQSIHKFIAAFLLLIFAFGATPKKFLHDAVTHHLHTHQLKTECSHHHVNVGEAGFSCQIDSLVVEMPFIATIQPVVELLSTQYFHYIFPQYNKLISTNVCVAYLRSPPAC